MVSSGATKVAPSRLCAEHDHLYLVIVAMSGLQFDATVTDGKIVALLSSSNSVTHGKVTVAVWLLEFHKPSAPDNQFLQLITGNFSGNI